MENRSVYRGLLVVVDMPFFVVRPAPIYQVPKDQSITLPCVAEGDPTPAITWKKVLMLYINSTIITDLLMIIPVRHSRGSVYAQRTLS